MRNSKRILLAACLLAMGSTGASAEPIMYDVLPEVVVTATRTENTVQNVPAATQIITEEDIKRSGSNDIRGLISHETNIFQKHRTRGGGHDVIIRGMDTDKTLILINGHRIANEADATGLGNAMAFDRISLSDVDRIEIVRGPTSALYGSEAMGGVINIITKPSLSSSATAGISRSSDDATNWYHFDTGRKGRFSATADMRFNKIFRDKDAEDIISNSYGTAQTYGLSANYYFDDQRYINLFYDYFSQRLKNDSGEAKLIPFPVHMGPIELTGRAKLDSAGSFEYKQRTYGVSYNGTTPKHDWQLRWYRSGFRWNDERTQSVLEAIPGEDRMSKRAYAAFVKEKYNTHDFNDNKNELWALEARDSVKINGHNRLTFGAEYVSNDVKGTNLGKNGDHVGTITQHGLKKDTSKVNIDTYAGYVQDEIETGKWFIVPAIRYDHHSNFGSHVSPKLGVTYKARDHLRFKANYGDGFKAPSVNQMYYSLYQIMGVRYVNLIGNPDLDPEESRSFDIAVEAEFGKGYGSLGYFDSHVKNLIDAVYIGTDGTAEQYKYVNIGKARIKGIETVLGYTFNDRWEAKVTSSWLSAKDTTNDLDLVRRARFSQIYQLIYNDHQDRGFSATLWDQLDYDYVTEDNEKTSYNLLNFTLTKRFGKDTRVYGTIENILDKKDDRCDLDGRFWVIGVEHTF